ncbi:hypothetical protein [Thermocrinis sp.]
MNMKPEVRGIRGSNCVEVFAKCGYFSGKYIYGGIFWSGEEEYAKNWSILIHNLLHMRKKSAEDTLRTFRDEMAKFLSNPKHKLNGDARYDKNLVVQVRGWKTIKSSEGLQFYRFNKDAKFSFVVGRVGGQEIDRRSGLVFLKIAGKDGEKVSREIIWESRKEVLRVWESLTDNPKVKEELSKVRNFIQILEEYMPADIKNNSLFLSLVGFVAPFDFKGFSGSLLVSRARLFEKKKTAEELLDELKKKEESLWLDLLHTLKNGIYKTDDENSALQSFMQFLKKWEDKDFLRELRKDWKEVLKKLIKGERKDFLGVFVRKDQEEGKLSYGTFFAPSKKIKLYVFYEKTLENKIGKFKEGFIQAYNMAKEKRFLGNAEIEFVESTPIENIIYNLKGLKDLNFDEQLKHEDSLDLLFSLLYFACRLKNLRAITERENSLVGILLLLDTDVREENGGYDFWSYFNFIYDYFGVPVQTLNRQTIEILSKPNQEGVTPIFKNLFISLLKDHKGLRFDFEGFELPKDLNIYVVLEKPSVGFCYERFNLNQKPERHFLYEIYSVKVRGNTAEIVLEDKMIVLAGGLDSDREVLRRWIEEKVQFQNVRFCFITASKWEDSRLEDIIAQSQESEKIRKKSLFVEYSELPTAYISEKAEPDCFVIYTTEFENLKAKLKIKDERLSTAIAIKPAFPKDDRFKLEGEERFYHSALQVFSTKGPGWEREEVYSEKKNLFLFSVLSLSLYESESYINPYSKLDLWQKRKTVYLNIQRNHKDYQIPLTTALYEMLYLLGKVPDLQ